MESGRQQALTVIKRCDACRRDGAGNTQRVRRIKRKAEEHNAYRRAGAITNQEQPHTAAVIAECKLRIIRAVYRERRLRSLGDFGHHFKVFMGKGEDRLLVSYDRDPIRPNTSASSGPMVETAQSPRCFSTSTF